jgi:hypothetical protein
VTPSIKPFSFLAPSPASSASASLTSTPVVAKNGDGPGLGLAKPIVSGFEPSKLAAEAGAKSSPTTTFGASSATKNKFDLPPSSSVEMKYGKVMAVGGVGNGAKDVTLSGPIERRKEYLAALSKLNEAVVWKVLETIEIAEPVKQLLAREKIQELMDAAGARTGSILTPVFASYNKALEDVEKDFPEFAIVFKKDDRAEGKEAKATEEYQKLLNEEKKEDAKASEKEKAASFNYSSLGTAPSQKEKASLPATFGLTHGHTSIGTKTTDSLSVGGSNAGAHPQPHTTNTPYSFGVKSSTVPTPPSTSTTTSTAAFGSSITQPSFSIGHAPKGDNKGDPKPFSFGAGATTTPTPSSAPFTFDKPAGEASSTGSAVPSVGSGLFTFGKPSTVPSTGVDTTENKTAEASKPTFGFPAAGATGFTFAAGTQSSFGGSSTVPTFSFAAPASGNLFGGAGAPAFKPGDAPKPAGDGDDEDYEPPVVEQKEVAEEGSYHQVKVKLFYKVDGNFASKGVGFLFLKKIDDGGVQVLVRADNATSNIIFNVKAVAGQKVLRLAKGNNVLFFCVPNPPVDPKNPSPDVIQVLLRTGSEAEGEKLFQELKKVVEPES